MFVLKHLSHESASQISTTRTMQDVLQRWYKLRRRRKNTSHMVGKALRQCVSLLKMIMNGGDGLFHGHPTVGKRLLHNEGASCFASFIKGIRLGRRDHFLAISYTDKYMDLVCVKHTTNSPNCVRRGQAVARQDLKIIIFLWSNRAENLQLIYLQSWFDRRHSFFAQFND